MRPLKYFNIFYYFSIFGFLIFVFIYFIFNAFQVTVADQNYAFLQEWTFCNFILFANTDFLKGISALLMFVIFYKIYTINLQDSNKIDVIFFMFVILSYSFLCLLILKVDEIYNFALKYNFVDECKFRKDVTQRSIKILRY